MSMKSLDDDLDVEVLDCEEPLDDETLSTSTDLVPYKGANLPVPVGQLGDIEAFIQIAERAPLLTQEEEKSLAIRLRDQNDIEAAQLLILSHLRLVIRVARGYLGYGLPYADLIQEGNIGLMKALQHYDPDRGARLMTFAIHWIKAEIQEFVIRNWRLVKLATTKNQRKLFFNLRQLKQDTHALTYQQAENIANQLSVKPSEVLEMEERMYGQEQGIDSPCGEDEHAMAPIDWLTKEDDNPAVQFENEQRIFLENEGLKNAIHQLDEREQRVIQARYLYQEDGDESAKPATLTKLAQELGVSAERVRQIEKQAIKKLRQVLSDQLM